METTYKKLDKAGCVEERVNGNHPSIGCYIVRASRLLYTEAEAVKTCMWLNEMVCIREGVGGRFKTINYKGSYQTWVVVRQLLPNDLVSGLDELVGVKQR